MIVKNLTNVKSPKSGVYIIKNTINSKIYVGSSSNFKMRLATYRYEIKNNILKSQKLLNSINKYNIENFEFQIVLNSPVEYMVKLEQFLIDNLKPELNIRKIAHTNQGVKRNAEWIERNRQKAIAENKKRRSLGIINGCRKLKESDATNIKLDISNGMRKIDIAKKYKVSSSLIYQIKNKKIWVDFVI